jgi:hypothetical protein
MAAPVNTADSYQLVGIREDLTDAIYNISPTVTPFLSACPKVKATNRTHEWQTDTLDAANAANAHIEGDDTIPAAIVPTVRLSNQTQIMKKAITVSDTDEGLNKAGREKEMAHQLYKRGKELKRDMEAALFANQARVTGSSVVARRMAGVPAWVKTNVAGVGAGGSNPTGDGSNARTDGSTAAFGQTNFDSAMQQAWVSGGEPDSVYLSATNMTTAQSFTGNNNQQSMIDADENKVVKFMSVYVTPWGTVKFIPSRFSRGRDVWIIQSDMWAVANLRAVKTTELAKTGDSTKRQLVAEFTLEARNEAANAAVVDTTG